MNSIEHLIDSLLARQIILKLEDQELSIKAPKGAVTPDILAKLKARKAELIQFLMASGEDGHTSITPAALREHYPLSAAQTRIWAIDAIQGQSREYNMQASCYVTSPLDVKRAQMALGALINRHEVLRTEFKEHQGQVVQVIKDAVPTPIEVHKAGLGDDPEPVIRNLMQQDAELAFDLSRAPLLRVTYLDLQETPHRHPGLLLLCMHHIISDAWSMQLLQQEFLALYQQQTLPDLPIQYRDYSVWQADQMGSSDYQRQVTFWRETLADVPPLHKIPTCYPRPDRKQHMGAQHQQSLSAETAKALTDFARQQGLSLFMLLHGALALVISRHSNEQDVVVGTPSANRDDKALKGLLGCFINTLVLRVDTDQPTTESYLKHVKEVNLAAQRHQAVPFEQLVEELKLPRQANGSPIVQILLNHNSLELTPDNPEKASDKGELEFVPLATATHQAKFDITLNTVINEQGGALRWTYDKALFSAEKIETIGRHFTQLLHGFIQHPTAPLSHISMLSKQERQWLTVDANDTSTPLESDKPVIHRIVQAAMKHPQAVALGSGDQQVTYQTMLLQIGELMTRLRNQGVKKSDKVAICLPSSPDYLISILAVMGSGAVYVPLLPDTSESRLSAICQDADVTLIIHTDQRIADFESPLPMRLNVKEVLQTADSNEMDAEYLFDCLDRISLVDTAYIIYTSGSTGKPKGVQIPHLGLADYCQFAMSTYYRPCKGSILSTMPAFDITVPALFLPLMNGHSVYFPAEMDPISHLAKHLSQSTEASWLLRLTPLHVQGLLDLLGAYQNADANHVFVIGGDSLSPDLARALQQRFPRCQIFNHYGPTETVVGSTLFDVTQNLESLEGSTPIGRPMDNTQVYVVDKHLSLVPKGTPGELLIGGNGMASGYLNLPQLSHQKFIDNPFTHDGSKVYRTGDRVQWGKNNQLHYLGRDDDQVKIRGFRIELSEINQAFRQMEEVSSAYTIKHGMGISTQLVTYLVAQANSELTEQQLIQMAKQQSKTALPNYAQPNRIVLLDELPLNANGKVDKTRLPLSESTSVDQVFTAPVTDTEITIAQLWADLLKQPERSIGTEADFFALGGHSLLAIRMLARLKDTFELHDVQIDVSDVFENAELGLLAERIDLILVKKQHKVAKALISQAQEVEEGEF